MVRCALVKSGMRNNKNYSLQRRSRIREMLTAALLFVMWIRSSQSQLHLLFIFHNYCNDCFPLIYWKLVCSVELLDVLISYFEDEKQCQVVVATPGHALKGGFDHSRSTVDCLLQCWRKLRSNSHDKSHDIPGWESSLGAPGHLQIIMSHQRRVFPVWRAAVYA